MRNIDSLFGAYDVRGIVNENLNSVTVRQIAQGYANYISKGKACKFVIGHDARLSSKAIAESFSVALRELGHSVTHIGLSTTPMVYWYGAEYNFDGSITVTASHLGKEHNGFKLCMKDALPLSGEDGLPDVARMAKNGFEYSGKQINIIKEEKPINIYVENLRKYMNINKKIRIAIDAGNGVGGIDTEKLLSYFDNIEEWCLDFKPNGFFPSRSPNPLENGALDRLSDVVIKNSLDFGVALDGDGDRLVVIDELGNMIEPDALGGIIAVNIIKNNPNCIILHDLRVSRAFIEIVERYGAKARRSRVGHAFIKRTMRKENALFAVELSGHYYYADLHYTDNGLRTLIELINVVSNTNDSLSELVKPFYKYPTSGEINFRVENAKNVINKLEDMFKNGFIDHLDGLSVDYDEWWFNVRPSHTEPLIRLNIGAKDMDVLENKKKEIINIINGVNS